MSYIICKGSYTQVFNDLFYHFSQEFIFTNRAVNTGLLKRNELSIEIIF